LTLRVIGTVGELINPEAWNWFNEHIGRRQCAIQVVDTFSQTEMGSIVITLFPGAIPTKPGSATVPFFGIDPAHFPEVEEERQSGSCSERHRRETVHNSSQ
jgi:acetyl-CoA synthetase